MHSYWSYRFFGCSHNSWRNVHLPLVSELTHNTLIDLKAQGFHYSISERRKALRRGRRKEEQLRSFRLYIFRQMSSNSDPKSDLCLCRLDIFRTLYVFLLAPESLTSYCRSILNEGKSRFFCPHVSQDQPPKHCNTEWDYLDVRRLAVLTEDEKEEFEDKITTNHLFKNIGIRQCPKCKSMVERNDKKDVKLCCTVCSKKDGKTYKFCWHCLKEWYNQNSRTQCGELVVIHKWT